VVTGDPKGIRTPVTTVKGSCPRPLDDRASRKANFGGVDGTRTRDPRRDRPVF
jgi:hypothetical protein